MLLGQYLFSVYVDDLSLLRDFLWYLHSEAPEPYIQEEHVPLLFWEWGGGKRGHRAGATAEDIAEAVNSNEGVSLLLTEVVRLVKLSLVVPATSASAERSFSALRRLKTHIRSTIGQPRLNHLLFLHCHKDHLEQLDLRLVAQEFVSANDKRSQFFGNYF